jgi:hypothetical protein
MKADGFDRLETLSWLLSGDTEETHKKQQTRKPVTLPKLKSATCLVLELFNRMLEIGCERVGWIKLAWDRSKVGSLST